MAQYLLSVWHDEDYAEADQNMDPADMERLHTKVSAFNEDVTAAGSWVFGGGLLPGISATVVRPAGDDDVSVTDGPYAESKEIMGGFWVLELPDLDAALEHARRASLACEGPVEVRPFQG